MAKDNRGFSVVELVVSIALLAIVLVPVAGFFTNSFKIQSKTSMQSSITRVGQYLMENFKNKNYLEDELKNDYGETFDAFVKGISLLNSASAGEPPEYSLSETIKESRNWKMNYKDVDYNIEFSIPDFTISDMSDFEIPEKDTCDGQVTLEADGTFTRNYPYNSQMAVYNVSDVFINPIDKKEYTANYPTIILKKDYTNKEKATLWIINKFGESNESWEKIRIIKEIKEELQVYIEGDNISISKGQAGDGASSAQTRITSSYVGKEVDPGKKSGSEILLDAKMVITKANDESIRDVFEFSFPVNYDYSKEGA